MAVTENKMIKDFVDAIKTGTKEKTKAYESPATVTRIENGVAWVHVPGGVEETPVQLTIAASEGDQVRVRVANGRATIVGNVTSPPTDDRTAREALYNANVANLSARSAEASASAAKQYAEVAKQTTDEINAYADTAGKTVTQILEDGEIAGESASSAYRSAQSALFQLGLVEDVLGTAEWIYSHSIYVTCTETEVKEGKAYFTLTGTAIANPTGNPHKQAYYELVSGKYVLSEDTEVDSQKTYYQVMPSRVAEPSGNPSTIPYYEREINEAVVQYINTHLALTDKGLSVTDGSRSSILISSEEGEEGVIIYGPTGIVAKYGRDAIIGDVNGYHIEMSGSKLSFVNGTGDSATEIAYMEYNELYIPRVVVVDSMQIGNWIWDAISSGNHLTLKWRG